MAKKKKKLDEFEITMKVRVLEARAFSSVAVLCLQDAQVK
jgi:hypothetical protein